VQRFAARIQGSRRYAYLKEYEALQWRRREELEDDQFRRLKALLRHAYETVPFYRGVFRNLGIHPDDIVSRGDYAKLPCLTKDIIKANRDALISSRFDVNALHANSTGGSTGEPLQFFQEMDVYERMCANLMLSLKMAGWREGERVFSIWGNPKDFSSKKSLLGRIKESLGTTVILNAYKYNEDVFNTWIKTIQKSGNSFIYGYPSVISDFSNYMLATNVRLDNVKGVQTSAEQLLDNHRAILEKAFQCKVYDQYGSRECPGIACECDHGGIHLLTHSSYVEFLDDPEAPGEAKKVVVTPLNSYAMPFMRYDIGDYAQPVDTACRCGRGFPLMLMKIGRLYDRFICEGGQILHGTLLVRQVAGIRGIRNFQFHQRDLVNIDLNIIRSSAFDADDRGKIEGINANLAAVGAPRVSIRVNYVDSFPQTIGGKHRIFISDVRS
jgi:phenylacetate-CoA ligase